MGLQNIGNSLIKFVVLSGIPDCGRVAAIRWPLIWAANYSPGRSLRILKPNLREAHMENRCALFSLSSALPQLKRKNVNTKLGREEPARSRADSYALGLLN